MCVKACSLPADSTVKGLDMMLRFMGGVLGELLVPPLLLLLAAPVDKRDKSFRNTKVPGNPKYQHMA